MTAMDELRWALDDAGNPCFDCGNDGHVTLTVDDLAEASSMRQVAREAHAALVASITDEARQRDLVDRIREVLTIPGARTWARVQALHDLLGITPLSEPQNSSVDPDIAMAHVAITNVVGFEWFVVTPSSIDALVGRTVSLHGMSWQVSGVIPGGGLAWEWAAKLSFASGSTSLIGGQWGDSLQLVPPPRDRQR